MRATPALSIGKPNPDEHDAFQVFAGEEDGSDRWAAVAILAQALGDIQLWDGRKTIASTYMGFELQPWIEITPMPGRLEDARALVVKHLGVAVAWFEQDAAAPAAEPLPFEIDHVERTKPATAAPATMKEATR